MDIMPAYNEVLNEIIGISDVNMNAIIRKNNDLKEMAHKAYYFISIFGTATLIISISFLFNFPVNIADPIKELTRGIKEIANKNYNQELYGYRKSPLSLDFDTKSDSDRDMQIQNLDIHQMWYRLRELGNLSVGEYDQNPNPKYDGYRLQ